MRTGMRGGGYDSGKKHGAAEMALDILNKMARLTDDWLSQDAGNSLQLTFNFTDSLQPHNMTQCLPLAAKVESVLRWICCALQVVRSSDCRLSLEESVPLLK